MLNVDPRAARFNYTTPQGVVREMVFFCGSNGIAEVVNLQVKNKADADDRLIYVSVAMFLQGS